MASPVSNERSRLEDKGLIDGRCVETAGRRQRRYYKLTPVGRRTLARDRSLWQQFLVVLNRIARIQNA